MAFSTASASSSASASASASVNFSFTPGNISIGHARDEHRHDDRCDHRHNNRPIKMVDPRDHNIPSYDPMNCVRRHEDKDKHKCHDRRDNHHKHDKHHNKCHSRFIPMPFPVPVPMHRSRCHTRPQHPDFNNHHRFPRMNHDYGSRNNYGIHSGSNFGTNYGINIGKNWGNNFGTNIGNNYGTNFGTNIGANYGDNFGINLGPDYSRGFSSGSPFAPNYGNYGSPSLTRSPFSNGYGYSPANYGMGGNYGSPFGPEYGNYGGYPGTGNYSYAENPASNFGYSPGIGGMGGLNPFGSNYGDYGFGNQMYNNGTQKISQLGLALGQLISKNPQLLLPLITSFASGLSSNYSQYNDNYDNDYGYSGYDADYNNYETDSDLNIFNTLNI